MNCARLLGVYDSHLIYSWTPREYGNRIKGAQLARVDETALRIDMALLNASAQRAKRMPKAKKVYDAEKIRKQILNGHAEKPKDFTLFNKAKEAINNFNFAEAYRPKK